MKNISLTILVAVSLALVSCGPATYSANGNGGYTNSIYYASSDAVPSSSQEVAQPATPVYQSTEDVKQLQKRTVASFTTNSNAYSNAYQDTIYVGDENIVNVEYNPETNYVIVDDDESYEARLKKFDSPTYVVNVVVDPFDLAWYNPFNWNYPYYRYRYGYHSSFYWNDWYTWRWGGWDPWGYGWNYWDRYYSWGWNWAWNWGWGWHDPWYYGGYYHRPYYHSHWYDRNWYHRPNRFSPGRYYTRRGGINERGRSFGRSSGVTPRSSAASMPRAAGSSYRRTPTVGNARAHSPKGYATERSNNPAHRNGVYTGGSAGRSNANRNAAVSRSGGNRNATVSRSGGNNNAAVSRSGGNNNAAVSRSGGNNNAVRRSTPGGVRYGSPSGNVSRSNGNGTTYRASSSNRGTVSSSRPSNGKTVYRQSSTPVRSSSSSSGRSYSTPQRSSTSSRTGYSNSSNTRSSTGYSSSSSSRSSGGGYSGGSSRSGSSSGGGSSRSGGSSTRR